jgi:hypothetical protein
MAHVLKKNVADFNYIYQMETNCRHVNTELKGSGELVSIFCLIHLKE